MARATLALVTALRQTAGRLESGATRYRWTHQGACNCGHLAQTLTGLDADELHRRAVARAASDWADQTVEYCPGSGLPIDDVIDTLLEAGLTLDDLRHLERLSDQRILRGIPAERRLGLDYRSARDAALYLRTWADQLAARLPKRTEAA
jgi:hypothetical protein